LETIAQRDRLVLLSALVGISAIAWAYTIAMSSDPGHGAHVHILAEPRAWTGTDFAMTFGMWTVMMLAMMLPTTAPMVLSLAKISRDKSAARSPMAPATGFLIGYAIVMTAFSLVAAVAQWGFHQAAWTSITGESTSRVFAAAVLLGAGGFGRFCIGCCWALMALMFVGGSMNLLWTAGLALFMLTEKVLPAGRTVGRIAGAGLVVWGASLLGTTLLAVS
jgi:predicted metal-binding membrane protein